MIAKIHIWDYQLLCHLILIQPIPIVKYIFNFFLSIESLSIIVPFKHLTTF